MKKRLLICLFVVLGLFIITGCKKEENKEEKEDTKELITKVESTKEGKIETVNITLNGKEHIMKLVEDNNHKVALLFDDQELLTFTRIDYGQGFTSDSIKYQEVLGTDNKYYFAFAMSNFSETPVKSSFQQYLYIFNDAGKIIYHDDDLEFGAAFTDYYNMESFTEMYGDTGKYKVEKDKIMYLEYFNYTDGEDYLRYYENVMTINNNQINKEQGQIIKVGFMK